MSLILKLNPEWKTAEYGNEYYLTTKEEAYDFLFSVAMMTGTLTNLKKEPQIIVRPQTPEKIVSNPFGPKVSKQVPAQDQTQIPIHVSKRKKGPIDFLKIGIPKGAELVCTKDPSIRVTVYDSRSVLYNGKPASLSTIIQNVMHSKALRGPAYFTYNGRLLTEIRDEMERKEKE